MLTFIQSDPSDGGVNTFISTSDIVPLLLEWATEALTKSDYMFTRTSVSDPDDSFAGPVFASGKDGYLQIRWDTYRPKIIDARGTRAPEVINILQRVLDRCKLTTYSARTGETPLIPNTTAPHGRTPLPDNSPREVFRTWLL